MIEENVTFYSEGEKISGILRLPEKIKNPAPGVVQGPGFLGLKGGKLYKQYHELLVKAGFVVLVFDYRGFGDSEGESVLYPERQVEDIRNAISYIETRDEVDNDRIGLFGSGGTGGGNAVLAAARDKRVKCIVCNNAVANGAEWVQGMRREYEWLGLLDAIAEDRRNRALTGESKMVPSRGLDGLQIPTPERLQTNVKSDVDTKIPQELPLSCAEAIIEYCPEEVVDRIEGGVFFICVENDDTTPERQSIRLYEKATAPKKIIIQRGTGHYEAYGKYFEQIGPQIVEWFEKHLVFDGLKIEEKN
tara:strand:+ start:24609 stop:25520 length:912 start_codon:yes stop_codon:yes gene_type:complete